MRISIILISFLFYFSPLWAVNEHAIVVSDVTEIVRLDSGIYQFTEKDFKEISIQQAIVKFNQKHYTYVNKTMPAYWMSNGGHWLCVNLKSNSNNKFVFEVNNVMIDELEVYILNPDSSIHHFPTSNWSIPVKNRLVHSYKNCYPLSIENNKTYRLFIRAKRTQGSLKIPLVIWKESSFYNYMYYENFKYGFFTGLILFISVFSLVIFFNIKDKKYLYYSLYCVSVLFWRLTTEGFVLEYFQEYLPVFQNPIWASVFMMFAALFSMVFLEKFLLNVQSKKWHFVFNKFTRYYILSFTIPLLIYGATPFKPAISFLYNSLVLCIVLNIILFTLFGLKRREKNAYVYLISVLPILIYVSVITLTDLLQLPSPFLLYDSFLWMLLFEMIVLSIGLAFNFKKFVNEKSELLEELNVRQAEAFKMQVQLQQEAIKRSEAQVALKNEKERISRDLHDSIGTDLSNIIYNIEYVKFELTKSKNAALSDALEKLSLNAKYTMDQLRSAIWVLNHDNITLDLFINKINSYVYRMIEGRSDLSFNLIANERNGETFLPVMHVLYLYRVVQECLSNTLKYSKATTIKINLGIEDNQIKMSFYDNGIGFDLTEAFNKDSYGLKNIKKRISELSGFIDIQSDSKGTEITIHAPLSIKNEHTN